MHAVIRLSPNSWQRLVAQVGRVRDRLAVATIALGRVPAWCWPLCVAACGWPSGLWAARRLLDDSDDPLGFVALGALLLALWCARRRFAGVPRTGFLAVASLLALVANVPGADFPDLVRALVASVAVMAALAAIADRDEPIAPYAGLAVLALPLLSSLQFYAGFPLRVVTAEASRWLLTGTGSAVSREGSALTVDGHLILVDAPCSGIRMAWVGYFTACVAAWLCGVSNRRFFATLPFVSTTVLAGNIVRNTLLVAADARGVAMTDAMHAAVGLVAFALVASIIALLFMRSRVTGDPMRATRPASRDAIRLRASLASLLVGAALLPLARPATPEPARVHDVEWPDRYDDRPIRPLALSPVELRFAAHFPGTIGRFAAGHDTLVLRDVERPTRRLHPAVDCYRGLGYTVADERLEHVAHDGDPSPRLWRCFTATRGGTGLKVCERIVDVDGQAYTDASSWYWAASLGRSRGPWRAVTIATPLPPSSGDRS